MFCPHIQIPGQDIAWFDTEKTLELPSSISGDTQLMREGIGMKFGPSSCP